MTKETKKNVDTINHGSIKRTPKRAAKKLTALLLSVIMVLSGVVGVWAFDEQSNNQPPDEIIFLHNDIENIANDEYPEYSKQVDDEYVDSDDNVDESGTVDDTDLIDDDQLYDEEGNLLSEPENIPGILTVTWNPNGGNTPNPRHSTGPSGTTINASQGRLATVTRSNHSFAGWWTTSALTGGTQINGNTQITTNVTYWARWNSTVSFASNGGSAVSPRTVGSGRVFSTSGTIPTSTRSGFSLDGWFNSGGTRLATGTTINGNITYTARWLALQPVMRSQFNNTITEGSNFTVSWESIPGTSYLLRVRRNPPNGPLVITDRAVSGGSAVVDASVLIPGTYNVAIGAFVGNQTPIWSNVTVTVNAPTPTSVSVSPTSPSVHVGDTRQFTANVQPANAPNRNVNWSSSNTNVATVNSSGLVTAHAAGTATITATTVVGGRTGSSTITVNPIIPTSVSVSPSSDSIQISQTRTLTANVQPTNATNRNVTWSSNNTSVATVNANTGVVTAHAAGTATITATTVSGGRTGSSTITVTAAPSMPLDFRATPGDRQVILNWSAPSSNGGTAITRYEVSSNNGSTWTTASGGANSRSHTFTSLTNGTSYTFRVRAVNAVGAGSQATATATPAASNVTLTFNGNGGSPATQSLDRIPNTAIGQLPTASRVNATGDIFGLLGWWTLQTGGQQIHSGTLAPNSPTTYWARWQAPPIVSTPSTNEDALPANRTVHWQAVSGATYRVTLRNLNTNEQPFTNVVPNGANGLSHTISTDHLTPGHRYRIAVSATVTGSMETWGERIFVVPLGLTLTLNPSSTTINDNNLTRTITAGGTATGTISINRGTLPSAVQITTSAANNTITLTATRPAAGQPAVTGTHNVTVTRGGVSQTLAVSVNLTAVAAPARVTFNPGAGGQLRIPGTNTWQSTAWHVDVPIGQTLRSVISEMPEIRRTGFVSMGWLDSSMQNSPDNSPDFSDGDIDMLTENNFEALSSQINLDTPISRATNLNPSWGVTLTLDANGGSLSQSSVNVPTHIPLGDLGLQTPTRPGHVFLGWSFQQQYHVDLPLPSFIHATQNFNQPQTIYAIWDRTTLRQPMNGTQIPRMDFTARWAELPGATYRVSLIDTWSGEWMIVRQSTGSRNELTIPQHNFNLGTDYRLVVEATTSSGVVAEYVSTFRVGITDPFFQFYGELGWRYPLPQSIRISSGFLDRSGTHQGIDIVRVESDYTDFRNRVRGEAVFAAHDGRVILSGDSGAGGFRVTLRSNQISENTDSHIVSRYMHLLDPDASYNSHLLPYILLPRQSTPANPSDITMGTQIGGVGNTDGGTGTSTNYHLHLDFNNRGETGLMNLSWMLNPERFFPYINFTGASNRRP